MAQKKIGVTSEVFNAFRTLKGKYMADSDVIVLLIKEHHELAKMKLEQERLAPC
jgi:hypothetical protein